MKLLTPKGNNIAGNIGSNKRKITAIHTRVVKPCTASPPLTGEDLGGLGGLMTELKEFAKRYEEADTNHRKLGIENRILACQQKTSAIKSENPTSTPTNQEEQSEPSKKDTLLDRRFGNQDS